MTLIQNVSADARGDEWVVRLAGHEIHASPIRGAAINVAVRARASIPGLQAVVAQRIEELSRTQTNLAAERRVDDVLAVAASIHGLATAYRAAVSDARRYLGQLDAANAAPVEVDPLRAAHMRRWAEVRA